MSIAVSPAHVVLTIGSKGSAVRQLQRLLNLRLQALEMTDVISVFVDGVFGRETLTAVKYLQCVGGFPVNGRVGDGLMTFLTAGARGLPVMSLGSRSTGVLAVQQAILRARISVLPDGEFGPRTEQAVKTYQEQMGLLADGIVGPQTWDRVVRSRLMELPCLSLLPNPYRL
ncbi:MAG: peptidoglycan-binding protein [Cyanobacteria bacterium J06623_4]